MVKVRRTALAALGDTVADLESLVAGSILAQWFPGERWVLLDWSTDHLALDPGSTAVLVSPVGEPDILFAFAVGGVYRTFTVNMPPSVPANFPVGDLGPAVRSLAEIGQVLANRDGS